MATCWLLRNNYDLYKFLTSQQIAKSHLIWLIYFHYKKIGPLKHINSSPNLLIIIPEAAWRRVESRISKKGEPPLESRVPPWYEIKLTPEILLDKSSEAIFPDINKNWKMTSSINFFCQGDLLVKVWSWYNLEILRYDMVLIFPCKSYSVNSDRPKIWAICTCSQVTWGGHFYFKMFITKFCLLEQSFISTAHMVLEL